MSWNISAWSIRKPIPTIVLFLCLTFAGLLSYPGLGIDANPNIDIPAVSVTVTQPGAGPTELEAQVTKKVEDAVAGIGNIDQLTSQVSDGVSSTVINFVLGTDSDRATNDVRNAIAQIRQSLPADVNDPVVQRLEFAGGPIMTYAVTSDRRSVEELSDLVDRTIAREILTIEGVAQVQRAGGIDREIRIDLNPERLQALGITATQVNDQIRAFNINLPGGRSDLGGSETNIRTLGSASSVETLKAYEIVLPQGGTVPLSELGQVSDGASEQRQAAFLNGQPVVAFSVLRSTGSTLVTVEHKVRQVVDRLETTLPEDVKLALIFTGADAIKESYQATIDALILGVLLTVATVWVFLRDWRPTLITAVTIPLSILPTFAVMQALGYTLNSMTLLALALAVGILVDDAIVEIENIERHIQMGKRPFKAALDASAEIGLAVIATTATIVAVFIPVAFMGGIPGQFFQPFGVVVSVSVSFSTLVARTVTNVMAVALLRPNSASAAADDQKILQAGYVRLYAGTLRWALKHRGLTLAIALVFFVGSLQLVPFIPKGLFDNGDTGLSRVSIEVPPGSTLQDTNQVLLQASEKLQAHPAVATVFGNVGQSGGSRGSSSAVNTGQMFVQLKPRGDRALSQREFEQEMRSQFRDIPGARLTFASGGASGGRTDLNIILKSENPEALITAANALESQMREVQGLVEISSSASVVKPELLIRPNPQRAADLGVSVQAIARTASLATLGDNEANLAKFDLADRQIPIRVQLDPSTRSDLDTLRTLRVPSQTGALVPLSAVADLSLGSGPASIDRFDRARQVSVGANLQGISLGEAIAQVNALPALRSLPSDVTQQPAGDAEIMQEIFSRFGLALVTGVLSIYAILVLLYNGFLHPMTIMVALPLSIGGALLGLLVTQKELGLFALIGIVLLMGIVTKNSILLVDYALMHKQTGGSQRQAVLEAGISRLRPILMTALATIAGMLPIALEIGAGSQTRSPLAIAVIGGFTTSTLLTLVVVPVIFTYVDNFQSWLSRRLQRRSQRQIKLLALSKRRSA